MGNAETGGGGEKDEWGDGEWRENKETGEWEWVTALQKKKEELEQKRKLASQTMTVRIPKPLSPKRRGSVTKGPRPFWAAEDGYGRPSVRGVISIQQETSTRDINSERCRNDDSGIGGEQCSSDDCDSRQRNSDGGAYRTRHCGL